jgi:hypothetical protein
MNSRNPSHTGIRITPEMLDLLRAARHGSKEHLRVLLDRHRLRELRKQRLERGLLWQSRIVRLLHAITLDRKAAALRFAAGGLFKTCCDAVGPRFANSLELERVWARADRLEGQARLWRESTANLR